MPNKLILSDETIEKVKSLYISGIGSSSISKTLNISKPKILKILNTYGLIRNNKHSEEFYSQFWEEDGMWCGYWKCETCEKDIKFSVNNKSLLNRNLKKKKTCRECSLKKQIGYGNPFYGKKHTQESITKMLVTQRKTLKQVSKPEIEIIKKLTIDGHTVLSQHIVEKKSFDIYLPQYNLLIEFNGDYWHCNPIKYSPDYFNKKKCMLAKDIWEYDKNKLYLAKNNGYACEVIWETDYKKNNNIVLEIIKKHEAK
jgi:G:T-mismatch repair DNA endonuclease (very short patch repair protein)